jgi:hypothetical protein
MAAGSFAWPIGDMLLDRPLEMGLVKLMLRA